MQDFSSFHIVCLIIVNKATKHWFTKTCLKYITASFRNRRFFFLIRVYVGFFPLYIWLHSTFGNIIPLWQDQFRYFWSLQILHWLAFSCLGCLSPFCWAGWQVHPTLHSRSREKPTDFCSFCNHSPQRRCWKAEQQQPSSWQHIIAWAHFIGSSTAGTYGVKYVPANHFQLSWSLRPRDTLFGNPGCSKHIAMSCGILLFPDLYPLEQKQNSSSRLIAI